MSSLDQRCPDLAVVRHDDQPVAFEPPTDPPAKGKAAFEDSCGVCHQIDTEEKGEKMGPGLKGLFKRAKMKNGKAPTEATLEEMDELWNEAKAAEKKNTQSSS